MIRYRRLYESENSDIKLYDVVRCAGYDWYVIDIDGDVVTLLTKNEDFGRLRFDRDTNDYRSSEIRKYIKDMILPQLINANPISTRLEDVGCTDKVFLLSDEEAEKLPKNIRMCGNWWWLRTPSSKYGNFSMNMRYFGDITSTGSLVYTNTGCVRPAMRVRVEDLD